DSVEVGRLRIWNGLTSYQQSLAIRSGRSSDVLLEPATISRRLMLTIVTTPETVVVTPVVEVCAEYGTVKRCGKRTTLQDSEVDALAKLVTNIKEAKPTRVVYPRERA